jgi:hypothetical protein
MPLYSVTSLKSGHDREARSKWPIYILLILLIKLAVFLLDPVPKFFFGDSQCYICSALTGWIPPDRSFTYGYVIKLTAPAADSFTTLLVVQTLASALSAVMLAYLLMNCFSVSPVLAYACGVLCAIEPIQLLYERFVMTETLSLFLFVCYIFLACRYVKRPALWLLSPIQLLGIALVSLRVSYLPIVLLNVGLLPLLAVMPPRNRNRSALMDRPGKSASFRPRIVHLAISIALTFVLHTGYKHLFASLADAPPGYHSAGGYFLVSSWAPILEPTDFPYPELRSRIFGDLVYDLKNRASRGDQLFSEGGLVSKIEANVPGAERNKAALLTAMNAFRRDTLGVVRLSIETYRDYFDGNIVRAGIMNDLGMDQVFEYEQFSKEYGKCFSLPGNGSEQPWTFTKAYYRTALPWYWLLLLSPLAALVALLCTKHQNRAAACVLFVAVCCSLATASALTVTPVIRYLHPVSWLALCLFGIILQRAFFPLSRRDNMTSGRTLAFD